MGKITTLALKWALIGGLAIIILQTIFMLISDSMIGGFWGIITYLPLLFIMIFAGISIRKENGGNISFGKALLGVFIIAFVGSMIYNIYVYQIWFKLVDPGLMDRIMAIAEDKIRDEAEKRGMTDDQIEMQLAFIKNLNFEKWGYIVSGICSVILSLIVSVFVSRPDKEQPTNLQPEP